MSQRASSLNLADLERDELPVDVLVVGAGPAGLACALDLARRFGNDPSPSFVNGILDAVARGVRECE